MSRYGYGYGSGGEGYGEEPAAPHERGSRRKKLAAMAGSVYRAGVAAASELKEQYNTRSRGSDTPDYDMDIPGAFPNVAIVTRGEEQMVLFPSYAKRHIKEFGRQRSLPGQPMTAAQSGLSEEEYWRQEWARKEDEKAVVDVDVHGWIYNPHRGPMTRRNRILIGLARRLSGIPAPNSASPETGLAYGPEENERLREEQRIAKEAQEIERKGRVEKDVATRGGYSEAPREDDSELDVPSTKSRSGSRTPISPPGSPSLQARASWGQPTELTEAELAVANANLMARIGPFLTTPLVQMPITLFFYNDTQSQSRTVTTSDAGHFNTRVALEFVPTHVRVLANEGISATEPVQIIERTGISMISDIDDTIKKSNISLGAKEIFRNTFIRDLADLTVDGVKEWYSSLYDMGVRMHYCSNSPWQLFPVISTFFHTAGLPPGSIHLKQYNGMLQGIFEPVAERKKGTLDKIMRDFPERRFLLVGDSGEADLEVYTELAVANPGRILALFIRDVTTPEQVGFFEQSFVPGNPRRSKHSINKIMFEDTTLRPALPPRVATAPDLPARPTGPVMGTLIDFSDEPEELSLNDAKDVKDVSKPRASTSSNLDLLSRKPPPPPRPNKPLALRSTPSDASLNKKQVPTDVSSATAPQATGASTSSRSVRSAGANSIGSAHPLAQIQNSSDQTDGKGATYGSQGKKLLPPPPPPPRRRGTPNFMNRSPRLSAQPRTNSNGDLTDFDALPGAAVSPVLGPTTINTTSSSPTGATTPTDVVSKKVDLWRRRLARAQETLDQHGVALYTWRRGEDVVAEAEGIVRRAMEAMERRESR